MVFSFVDLFAEDFLLAAIVTFFVGKVHTIYIILSDKISILLITDRENPKPAGINSRAGYRSERSEELLARLFIPKGEGFPIFYQQICFLSYSIVVQKLKKSKFVF